MTFLAAYIKVTRYFNRFCLILKPKAFTSELQIRISILKNIKSYYWL